MIVEHELLAPKAFNSFGFLCEPQLSSHFRGAWVVSLFPCSSQILFVSNTLRFIADTCAKLACAEGHLSFWRVSPVHLCEQSIRAQRKTATRTGYAFQFTPRSARHTMEVCQGFYS
jgi:hypothetical protein